MKKIILLLVVILSIMVLFSCTQEKEHIHVFDNKKIEEQYLAKESSENEPARYYYSCSCGEKGEETFEYILIDEVSSDHVHVFDLEIADEKYLSQAATYNDPAQYYYSCSCGEKGDKTFSSGEKLEQNHVHSFEIKKELEYYLSNGGDCNTPKTYYYSCLCGEKGSETFTVGSATGHHLITVEGKNPTCLENGYKTYYYCKNCSYTTYQEISKTGHIPAAEVKENVIHATFASAGSCDVVVYCSSCGIELSRTKTILNKLTTFTIKYSVDNINHGYVSGNLSQTLSESKTKGTQVTAVANLGYKFSKWSDGNTSPTRTDDTTVESTEIVAQFVVDAKNLPILEIELKGTELSNVTKDTFVSCTVNLSNTTDKYTISSASARFRGRGNGTWYDVEKKSYKIKFDSKQNLFGFGKNKDWILLPNYFDTTLIRNYMVFETARLFPTQQYSPKSTFVELFVNGEYRGVYQLSQGVEAANDRVDIKTNPEKYAPSEIGYLVEMDQRMPWTDEVVNEDITWFYDSRKEYAYILHAPEPGQDGYTQEYLNYIKKDFNKAYSLVLSGTWDQVCRVIDVDSFAENYIIYELFVDCDVNYSSFYLYKPNGGKLVCGPVWDFDSCAGNTTYQYANHVEAFYAKKYNPWFKKLFRFTEFNELVCSKYTEYYSQLKSKIDSIINEYKNSNAAFNRNFEKFNLLGKKLYREPGSLVKINTYTGVVEYLQDWLNKRFEFLSTYYYKG